MKITIKTISILSFLVILGSCDILEKQPLDGPADVNFLQNEAELIAALNGVYNNLWYSTSASGQWEYILDTTTDISWDRNGSIFTTIGNGSHSASNSGFEILWTHLYEGISRSNFILDNLERVQGVSPEVLNEVEGQVRFLRAYWYSQLITLWGDVPLLTESVGLDESNTPRTDKETILEFLLDDLDLAAEKLPETWSQDNQGRVTQGAALALKARIALYNERFNVAAESALQVLNSNVYELYPDYRELFQYEGESSSEVIFEVMYQYGIRVHSMPVALGTRNTGRSYSTKVPTQAMVDSYEMIDGLTIDESPLYDPANPFVNRDPRLKQSIATPGDIFLGYQFETHRDSVEVWNYNVDPPVRIANQDALSAYATFTGYLWKKMTDTQDYPEDASDSSLNFILIRLGEVLLTYAEAKIELNQIDESVYNAINRVRGRESVQMPPIEQGKSQDEMREIIRRERKIELAMEGFRLADIRRWGIAEKAMSGPLYGRPTSPPYTYQDLETPEFDENGIPNYSSFSDRLRVVEQRSFDPQRDYLWPIPQSEIDVNDQLTQNPGY